ncbi:hypothetical protein ACFO1B_20955 [Dactylosporangium siamense]|uniref:Uncharacterized protein n=1 Tax=Dactylosporangium siamense TaxID=685454 RepID=A0A919U9E7_9ACTN|nr:hypothetical protein [Dactylosporangium siamense]GIG46797.1 hypothetical protein Dsi01nite_048380 [Dactylosporangium siamense]
MTTAEHPQPQPQPQPDQRPDQKPDQKPDPEPRPNQTGPAATDQGEDTDDAVRSLAANMIRSYGILDSEFLGPSAIGPGSTSIGTVLNVGAGLGRRRFINQPLDEAMVLERIHTYTATATPDRLVERLTRRPVAYLSGTAGSGRVTAALVGLARTHGSDRITQLRLVGDDPIHAYLSDRTLLRSDYGHIVELARTVEPEPSELAQLSVLAREAHAAVVLVGAAETNNRQLVEYHVEHARPDPRDVFLVWLERWLGDRGSCIDTCPTCEGECVRRYVERCRTQHLRHLSANTMADAVRFAAQFAELVPDAAAAVDLLADRTALRAKAVALLEAAPAQDGERHEAHRARRLAQHRRAARLAFAVFNGYPLTRVFTATEALCQRLDEATGRGSTDRTVLEHNLDHLLDGIRNDLPTDQAGPAGAARIARLRQPGLVRGLLDVAWHEYDTARQPLLRWLDDLVGADDVRPVAAAAGLLCEYDFGQIRRHLLENWAASNTRSRREAAALACELAVHNPELAPRVLACVAGWVEQAGNRRDTAVRTYATNTFRRRYPLDALAVLERAARDDMQRTSNAIPVGVRGIYTTNGAAVVQRLVRWPDSPVANLRTMASRCLLQLADMDSDAVGEAATKAWPALLRQTATGEVSAADHANLWPGALLNPATARQAWSVFERWIGLAADDTELTSALCELLGHVLRDGPINQRARFYLRCFWRRSMPDNPILDTVDSMLGGRHHDH